MERSDRRQLTAADSRLFVTELYGQDLHAKRVESLAGATLGVMRAGSLAVALIGQALAQARGLVTKHAIKQVDRMLSNHGIDVWDSLARWIPFQIGERRDILAAMDWTAFDHDDQATLVLSMVTGHGRAAPLLWLSVWKDELKNRRNDFEDACLRRLAGLAPPGCRVTILADRGFGDQKLFAYLPELGFSYVIRFRGNIHVSDAEGRTRPAAEWVGKSGRATKLLDARVTAQGRQVGAVVCVHAKGMKEPWCLASSERDATAATLINHYAKRWTIESHFKTLKYQPQFPQRFGCIEDARSFCRRFFDWYNQNHHHTGIGVMTPDQVHYGQVDAVHAARQETLKHAFRANPERFVNKMPAPPAKPTAAWINPPTPKGRT